MGPVTTFSDLVQGFSDGVGALGHHGCTGIEDMLFQVCPTLLGPWLQTGGRL